MNRAITIIPRALLALAAFAAGGCYSYQPPPRAAFSDNYTRLVPGDKLELPDGVDIMTLELARRLAEDNNPSVMSATHAVGAAREIFHRSLSEYLPTATGNWNFGENRLFRQGSSGYPAGRQPAGREYSFTNQAAINSQLLIFDGLARTMNMLAARAGAKGSEDDLRDARRTLRLAVDAAYNELLLSRENIRIADSNLSFNRTMLQETETKFEAGAVALPDVLNFRITANHAEDNLLGATYRHRAAKHALGKLLGLSSGTIPEEVTFPEMIHTTPVAIADVDYYLDTALGARPDLASYRQSLAANEYSLYAAWGAFSPKVYATNTNTFGAYRTNYKGADSEPRDYSEKSGVNAVSYGGNVQWRLFEGGNRVFAVRGAQALVAQGEYQVASKWLQVVGEVRAAVDEYHRNARQLALLQNIREDSSRNRDLVEQEYQQGAAAITRLNEAQNDLVRTEANLAGAYIKMLNAMAQLEAAVGGAIFDWP